MFNNCVMSYLHELLLAKYSVGTDDQETGLQVLCGHLWKNIK